MPLPRDSNGNFSLDPVYIAVPNTVIQAVQHNTPLGEIVDGLTGSLARNGSGGMQANLKMGGYKIVNLLAGTADTDAANVGQIVAPVRGGIFGLTQTINGTDPTNDIDIATGEAVTDTSSAARVMVLASALTKRLDAAWAVGSGNGGRDTGSVADGTWYVWLIQRSDTGVVDVLFSLSSTAPTMPASYDRKRVIGSFARSGGVNGLPRSYSEPTTQWVSYTPTFTGFGTVSGVDCYWRRVGDTLELDIRFVCGTSTATQARMSLPSGLTSVTGPNDHIAGYGAIAVASAGVWTVIIEQTQTYVTFGKQDGSNGGLTKANGNALLSNGNVAAFRAAVRIAGW